MAFDIETMNQALRQARAAQVDWAAKPLAERLAPIARLRSRLAAEPKTLAEVVAKEIGKSRYEAIGAEVLPIAEVCGFLMDRAPRVLLPRRETLRGTMPFTGTGIIRRVPYGVVAVIVPWNYPLYLCASSTLNALAAGNAVALKASPRAKETVAAFGQWLRDAGVPAELAPVLDSSDDAGRALVASPLVDKVVFTGSSRTGRAVLAAAAQNLVPATVELSGYDAVFILRDANVELAAAAVTFGLRINAGRTCVCPRRAFVERPVADAFFAAFRKRLATHKLLAPMDPQTLKEADELAAKLATIPGVSPLNARAAGDNAQAIAVLGGREALVAAQGNFVPAIIAAQVEDMEEALRLEAASPYALGAAVFSRDVEAAAELAARLRSGTISINECVAHAGEAALPFGGTGESGYGVRGGEEGLLDMTRAQALAIARGTFRPHHDAEDEAEEFVMALLRARHAGSWLGRAKGWFDYAVEGVKWKPRKR